MNKTYYAIVCACETCGFVQSPFLHVCALCVFRMKRYLNCITDTLCVFQRLEIEIAKVEEVLKYFEDEGTQCNCKINDTRRYLKQYLNNLYQAKVFLSFALVEQYLTRLKHLQVIFSWYAGTVNIPVEVQLLKHGVTLPTFLVKSISLLSVVKKGDIRRYGGSAEMAAIFCDGSHLIVSTNTLIVCPVSKRVKKRPLKENEGQNEVSVVLSICSFDNLYDYCV